EPCEGKLSCTVLRGESPSNGADLLDNSMPNPGFSPYFIPMHSTPLIRNHFGTTPAGTALFFRMIGQNKHIGTYQLYIEAKFNGYGTRDFKLSKSYAVLGDWTIGYAPSTFSDGSAVPPTVDANGPTMKMDNTAVLIRYMHNFRKGFSIAASVETPDMTLQTTDGVTASRATTVPNFAALVQYSWAHDQHVRLSAIARFLPYRNLINNTNHTPVGYGLQLSTVFNPTPALTIYGTINGGKSYSNYGGDFMLGEYDLVENPDTPGKLDRVPGWGYFIGIGYNFSTRLFATATFGEGRYLPSHGTPGSNYKYGLYGAANLFYDLTPRIRFGAEFNFGKRRNFNGEQNYARRIGAMCQFSF
ncbi:MAG: hypothetical protein K2J52_03280, partial [Duncaniella sp.]|nr:hypothetical protein [Duncaniella sp.]